MPFTYADGSRPLDGYVIERGLGQGGFGEVYRAVSDGGKIVALKLVQRHLEVELRGVAQCLNLNHPNLVTLYDIRQAGNGDCWVVMEYLAGDRLDQVLDRHPRGLEPAEALHWLRGICAGLAYLHGQHIVHRDLKPANLFMQDRLVKIGDYGLAKLIVTHHRSGQTQSIGTVHYMAPEIANGRYGKEIDLYAVGVILYEMLAGRVPFHGQTAAEILMKHLTAEPDLSAVPADYRLVVARLLSKDPERRYASTADLLADLERKPVEPLAATATYLGDSPDPHAIRAPGEPRFAPPPWGTPAISPNLALEPPPPDPVELTRDQLRIAGRFVLVLFVAWLLGGPIVHLIGAAVDFDNPRSLQAQLDRKLYFTVGTAGLPLLLASWLAHLGLRGLTHYATLRRGLVIFLLGPGVGLTTLAVWHFFESDGPVEFGAFLVVVLITLATWIIAGWVANSRQRLGELERNRR